MDVKHIPWAHNTILDEFVSGLDFTYLTLYKQEARTHLKKLVWEVNNIPFVLSIFIPDKMVPDEMDLAECKKLPFLCEFHI